MCALLTFAGNTRTHKMPKLAAVQPQWRSRREAIGKKGAVDYELLMESEVDFTISGKEPNTVTNSPTSIESTHAELAPEMKPLPGAWVTVGKGGRPVSLMYRSATVLSTLNPSAAEFLPAYYVIEDSSNEAKHVDEILRMMQHLVSVNDSEQLMLAKQFADADAIHDLEEEIEEDASSSRCLQALGRSTRQREKVLAQAKDAKYWRKYQQTKHLKVVALDTLIATLAEEDEGANEMETRKPSALPRRNDKGSSHGAKARRKARFASAAARCYMEEDADEMPPVPVHAARSEQTPASKSVKERVALRAMKRERVAKTEEQCEGVSPEGKGHSEAKVAKHQSGEGDPAKEVAKHSKKETKKKETMKQCVIA